MFKIRTQFILYVRYKYIYFVKIYDHIVKETKKSVTNIHLNIKVINKGPSEHFWE